MGGSGQGGANLPFMSMPGMSPVFFNSNQAQGGQSGLGGFLSGLMGSLPSSNTLGQMAGYGGMGLLGGLLASKTGLMDPRVVNDPRNQATDWFSKMLQGGGNVGQMLGGQGMLPGYQGPWSAGADAGQQQAMGAMSDIFGQFMNGGQQQGQDILSQLGQRAGANFALPPELQAAMGGMTAGNPFLTQLAGGQQNPFMSALAGVGNGQPMGTDMIGGAGQWLQQQMGNGTIQNLLQGGQTADIGGIAAALDAARRPGLNRDIANLRENFSFNGLRRGTDIQNAVAARQAESESGMMGQLAQMMPQLTGQSNQTSLGTLNAISNLAGTQGQLGQMLGNLGLGQGQLAAQGLQGAGSLFNQGLGIQSGAAEALNSGGLGAFGALGNLFNNQQGNSLQALLAMPGAFQGLSQLPGQMASQLFGMGTTLQNNSQQGIQNQIAGFNQQQSLIPLLMQFLSGTPQQQVTPSMLAQLGQLGLGAASVRQGK
jgi:hypothetical protein